MKIISTSKDIELLAKFDQYIIIDTKAKNPESINLKFIKDLQDKIEKKFSTESIKK